MCDPKRRKNGATAGASPALTLMPDSIPPLRWGLLATGGIARTFALDLPGSATGRLAAVGSRTEAAAERFGTEFGLTADACHGSYEALLADERVDVVYLSTPHPTHAEWAIRCAEAGKHILCEKPLAMNAREGEAIVAAARRHGVFLMEAFMYRCHPQTIRLAEEIRAGAVGEVRLIEATFGFHAPWDPRHRLFDPALGGGGILDVGCYTVSGARLVAGAARGEAFADPEVLTGVGHLGETGVDEWAAASLRFPGGVLAQVFCATRQERGHGLRVFGSEGWLEVVEPWAPGRREMPAAIRVFGKEAGLGPGAVLTREIVDRTTRGLYALEADVVAASIAAGATEAPAMSWADSLGNLRALDRWRECLGSVGAGDAR